MRKLIVSALLLLFPLLLPAQILKLPQKKNLQEENLALKARVDSLQALLDSLLAPEPLALDPFPAACPDTSSASDAPQYSDSQADSLLGLWYRARRMNTFSELSDFNLDSVRLSSNVPDSVLIRRLSDLNPFITLPFNETVKNYMVMYSEKMPTRMRRMLGLSGYYFPIFEAALAKYDLPQELKYMSVIESALNATATSRAGARGMWQFMYVTARQYGLSINSFVDERLDVEKAADAAARYLSDSYKFFGDWNLAISSYNCGIGNVRKAIKRAGSTAFWDIYPFLPRETRGYVPAFVGAMYAFSYYREYGLVPDDVGMPAPVDTFYVARNLHFKQIDEVAGIPIQVLKDYNPQYIHDIIPGGSKFVLKLPFTYSGAFLDANPDSLYTHRASELMNAQIMKNIEESGHETRMAYRVKSGDYLGRIASRYHVTVQQIMKWNHLRSSSLRVGQVLYIYRRGSGPSSPAAAAKSASSKPSQETRTSSSSGSVAVYTVRSGDTFYSIAKKYSGVSAQNLMDYNGLKSSALRPGMKLKIPASK